jgi:hypothetical protein
MSDLSVDKIKNFPRDNHKARLYLCKREGRKDVLYVVESDYIYEPKTKKTRTYTRYLGRVVEGVYYTQSEYRKTFTKRGTLRAIPEDASLPRSRIRPTRHRAEKNIVDRDKVKGLPKNPFLQFAQKGEHLYVFTREYYIQDGRRKEKRTYIGQIKDLRFYTMEQYKKKFNKNQRVSTRLKSQEDKSHG